MEYYIIAVISFSIMYYIRYTLEIIPTVLDTLELLDIKYQDCVGWSPITYSIASVFVTLVGFPFFLYIIIVSSRTRIVQESVRQILKGPFGLEEE